MILFDKLFKRKSVRKKALYAVTAGDYHGQFIVFESDVECDGVYNVIFLPDLERRSIQSKDIIDGLNNGILDFVKRLRSSVYHEIIKQTDYKELSHDNETLGDAYNEYINRREQLVTPNILGKPECEIEF